MEDFNDSKQKNGVFMIKVASKLKIYLYSALALSALAMLLTAVSYLVAFDSIGYFSDTVLPSIANALCLAAAVWFLASLFVIPKNALDGATPTTLVTSLCATPFCVWSLFLGGFLLYAYLENQSNPLGIVRMMANGAPMPVMLASVFLLISAIYFALAWFPSMQKKTETAVLGLFVPPAAVLLISLTYFDFFVPLNSPVKLHFQLSTVLFILFSVYELRALIGKPRPRAYFALAMLTVFFSSVSSVPQIVAYLGGKLTGYPTFLYAIFSLCILIYTVGRLIVFVSARDLLERISDQTYTEEDLLPAEDEAENEND